MRENRERKSQLLDISEEAMDIRISYGTYGVLEVKTTSPVNLVDFPGTGAAAIDDVNTAVREALDHPLQLPPLAQCVTPGDRVVLALRRGTPRGAEILAAVARYLIPIVSSGGQLTVLRTESDETAGRGDPRPFLSAEEGQALEVLTHRADRQEELALLARFRNGRPLRLNRALIDADVVIPVGCTPPGKAWSAYGTSGAVFPTFSDRVSQLAHWRDVVQRTRRTKIPVPGHGDRTGREANWLLGTQFAIEVVPGPHGSVLNIVAGAVVAARQSARDEYRKWWCPKVDGKAELVIAGVDHNPSHTPWENLAQAAWTAARLVRRGGQIVLMTDWDRDMVPQLINENSLAEVSGIWSWSDFLQTHGDLAVPFWLLARVRRHARVCLWTAQSLADESLSGWRERLSLETTSGEAVINRLIRHVESCTVFSHASLAWPKVSRGPSAGVAG